MNYQKERITIEDLADELGVSAGYLSRLFKRQTFSSQSHFIQQFRESVGMMPKKYRDEYYMVQWETDKDHMDNEKDNKNAAE